ncbi:hypothetical protein [Streptomyces sp. CT34]|uniref:hypothetical protein n=1 Tax=Streptomyces sp. CT34 TaxID=1553907 RepID=UPI0012FE95C3|nr:hypothetical protein [Streptomyces sp. CT34]
MAFLAIVAYLALVAVMAFLDTWDHLTSLNEVTENEVKSAAVNYPKDKLALVTDRCLADHVRVYPVGEKTSYPDNTAIHYARAAHPGCFTLDPAQA